MRKLIALLLLLSTPAYADNAVTVHTGDVVEKPFDGGTLLTRDQAKHVSDEIIDGESCNKQNDSYQKSVDLYKNNEKLYQDENSLLLNRNIELTKTLNEAKSTSDWVKVGYFALGVVVVGMGVYGAKQLTK